MSIALNFTVPLKQDPQSQQSLTHLVASFSQDVQPALDAALSRSQIVHFARILVIDNKYLQVLTEFDGDPMDYTEFFRKQLGPVFQAIFALAEGAPPWDELNNPNSFYEYTRTLNLPSLGTSTVGNEGRGYLFSAVGVMPPSASSRRHFRRADQLRPSQPRPRSERGRPRPSPRGGRAPRDPAKGLT